MEVQNGRRCSWDLGINHATSSITGQCMQSWVSWMSRPLGHRPWWIVSCNLKGPEGCMLAFYLTHTLTWDVWILGLFCMKIIKSGLLSLGLSNSTRSNQNKFIFRRHHCSPELTISLILWITALRLLLSMKTLFLLVPLVIKPTEFTFCRDDEPAVAVPLSTLPHPGLAPPGTISQLYILWLRFR